jgi:hypothetical protein
MLRAAYGSIPKLELEGGMRRVGGESIEGCFGHTDDHSALWESISLASRTLERDGAIDGDGERHNGDIVRRGIKSTGRGETR